MPERPTPNQDPGEPDDLPGRLLTALVCSALEPSLTGVLLFDLPPEYLSPVAGVFADMLGRSCGNPSGRTVPRTFLDSATLDEDLWIRPRVHRGPAGIEFTLGPGPLAETGNGPRLVVVPDLARLSVPGMRAAVRLLGADTVAHTDHRHDGRPRTRWLACCRAEDTELVSPHLLDRFSVRLAAPGLRPHPGPDPLGALPADWARALDPETPRPCLTLTDEAASTVLEHLDERESGGHRRELALARIARGLARLDEAGPTAAERRPSDGGPRPVTAGHVDRAARLIRLRAVHRPGTPPQPPPEHELPGPPRPGSRPHSPEPPRSRDRDAEAGTPVHGPDSAVPLGLAPAAGEVPHADVPYPEDRAGPGPGEATLRTPARRTTGGRASRGPVVGVRRARDLWDLAPVRTAMEAAKYRAVRGDAGDSLVIAPPDLRGYVRAPEPVRTLTLVLDHTCRGDWDWYATLEPFLHWAYVTRASVQIVEVGGEGEPNELRSRSFTARSTRDPRIAAALARRPGRATPLAHGLDLAGQALRRAFRHHSAGLIEALLVVVTDGRGNVPLTASRSGRPGPGPVQRAGVDDAVAVAGHIRALGRSRLRSVVVDPGRHPYSRLATALAEALGGGVVGRREAGDATGPQDPEAVAPEARHG
ncbi:hypothetical protein P8A18_23715 [Streptomyces castrisilvae]|uniref:Magnesium chelatase n=1 Tax=Streptomyces castrisilvae TaxID=3033811 RepID=A0ABY9HNX4_9ACTN|nr:hypothetical protein [Streptomyces sp. Mut1]WLQ36246.1 hypothetical protein P8A18_23715 [Streptomyces sp. Mut1]